MRYNCQLTVDTHKQVRDNKPLLPTEVPETLVPLFFFDRQFTSGRGLRIWVGDQPSGARVRDLYLDLVREAMLAEGCDQDAVDRMLGRLCTAPDSTL